MTSATLAVPSYAMVHDRLWTSATQRELWSVRLHHVAHHRFYVAMHNSADM